MRLASIGPPDNGCEEGAINRAPTNRLLFFIRLQRVQRLLHQFPSQFFLVRGWQFRIAGDVYDASS